MAAVRSLCTRGVVLQNGVQVFDGSANEAVDFYTEQSSTKANGKIADNIDCKVNHLKNIRISFNGTESLESTIEGNQKTIEIKIEGTTLVPIDVAVKIIFKTLSGVPIMSFAEGRCTGNLERLDGDFSYSRNIRLPRFMAQGDFVIDVCMHMPSVTDYFYAKDCAVVHVQSSDEIKGLPLYLRNEGAFSLVSVSDVNEFYTCDKR